MTESAPDDLDVDVDVADADADAEHDAAVRTVRLLLAAGVLVVVALVAVLVAGSLDDHDDGGGAADPALSLDPLGLIGPATGTDVATYVAERAATLAAADGDRVAVVSLVSYRGEDSADRVAAEGGGPGIEVLAHLVALPGGDAEAVEGPVAEWLAGEREPLQAERDEIAALLPTIEDPADPFVTGYTEELTRLDAQLAALTPDTDAVFGLVVRGPVDALRRLATRPEVRLLDVAPTADLADLARYRGIRPDEVTTTGTPPFRT